MEASTINGYPIPLEYLTPYLNFYPPVLPENLIFLRYNIGKNTHINRYIPDGNPIELNEKDHLHFIKRLMEMFERNYTIIGNFLIDLDRKDYKIKVNDNIISNVITQSGNYEYINENLFKKKVNLDETFRFIEKYNKNYYDEKEAFIDYHCFRIYLNTKIILLQITKARISHNSDR